MPKKQCQNTVKVLIILTLFLLTICFILSAQTHAVISYRHFKEQTSAFENFFNIHQSDSKPEGDFITSASEEPIFWDLPDGANISYNPVVLFVNYHYWDSLPFYSDEEEYIFEMYANETTIFNSSYEFAKYNQYYWNLGYDWNVSHYLAGNFINVTAFFYQESDPSRNHTASIGMTIGNLKETPVINLENFSIHLFHWPGEGFSYGYYYYDPDGLNPYYHFAISSNGYVSFKFGDAELMENKDMSSTDVQELLNELISLGFFQLKDYYRAPGYDYYYDSFYQIAIQSNGVDEWRQAEEAKAFVIKPEQFSKCLIAIKNRVDSLYFTPTHWKWELLFIIGGSILGGAGVLFVIVYFFMVFRRRR
ncbi:MAG: hypothetical protein K9W42_04700 [Candidatus Heimdallarchaeota archaeon]|nr:hypothetical protein [Candidatus Heimdallarchaeota archaeon]